MATLRVYLGFLAAFPDSHVVRKFGADVGRLFWPRRAPSRRRSTRKKRGGGVRRRAVVDASLKERGLNPGTSADLTVATLFSDYVAGALANACKNG